MHDRIALKNYIYPPSTHIRNFSGEESTSIYHRELPTHEHFQLHDIFNTS